MGYSAVVTASSRERSEADEGASFLFDSVLAVPASQPMYYNV